MRFSYLALSPKVLVVFSYSCMKPYYTSRLTKDTTHNRLALGEEGEYDHFVVDIQRNLD